MVRFRKAWYDFDMPRLKSPDPKVSLSLRLKASTLEALKAKGEGDWRREVEKAVDAWLRPKRTLRDQIAEAGGKTGVPALDKPPEPSEKVKAVMRNAGKRPIGYALDGSPIYR